MADDAEPGAILSPHWYRGYVVGIRHHDDAWWFSVDALGIVGGGCSTLKECMVHVASAVDFALATEDGGDAHG